MKYFIKTFGCQSNKSDSERIAGDYRARGYKESKSWQAADEIVVNTCAVRQRAEDRAQGFLINVEKHFSSSKKNTPKIILTGCMTHHSNKKILEILPQVDEVLPINEVGFNQAVIRRDKQHAWVPISIGCNSFCTYCIVPYSRGREVSRPKNEIIQEIKDLAFKGYTEITLLGMNVNSWGLEKVGIGLRKMLLDLENPLKEEDIPTNQSQYLSPKNTPPFVKLLQEISAINGIEVIRFLTSNPWDFHDRLIQEIADNHKIDRYIHLPIQSGSNKILKLMNRGYTKEDYINLVQKLRKNVPNIVLGTDIIVGFPNETKKDFQETVNLVKKIDWKIAFVAQYSPRPGTAAYRLYPDDIPPQEKKRRWEILDDIINKKNMKSRPFVV
ncbi:MiaB/RimO family radical SAM methylthiotransferase [Pseudomonadota bacterium]